MTIRDEQRCSHIILSSALAREIMADDNFKTTNMVDIINDISLQSHVDLKPVLSFINNSPVFLSGDRHAFLRKIYIEFYRHILTAYRKYIQTEAGHIFDRIDQGTLICDPGSRIVTPFVDTVFNTIIREELGDISQDWVNVPSAIFEVLPNIRQLQTISGLVGQFLNTYGCSLEVEYHTPEELKPYNLLTFQLMGREPVIATITSNLYAMSCPEPGCPSENKRDHFAIASPVNVVRRYAVKQQCIIGLDINAGDSIYLVLSAINGNDMKINDGEAVIPFGYGRHVCPGKNISNLIVDAFFNAYHSCTAGIIIDKPIKPESAVMLRYQED